MHSNAQGAGIAANLRLVGVVLCLTAGMVAVPTTGSGARADAPLIVLDRGQLPFDLGPGAPANSPARVSNSPNAAWNSAGNSANSPSVRANRPDNPANSRRLIFTADGTVHGYYVRNAGGVLNLFDIDGRRVGYAPGGRTRSVFRGDGAWCGTIDGPSTGDFVLAITPECAGMFSR